MLNPYAYFLFLILVCCRHLKSKRADKVCKRKLSLPWTLPWGLSMLISVDRWCHVLQFLSTFQCVSVLISLCMFFFQLWYAVDNWRKWHHLHTPLSINSTQNRGFMGEKIFFYILCLPDSFLLKTRNISTQYVILCKQHFNIQSIQSGISCSTFSAKKILEVNKK